MNIENYRTTENNLTNIGLYKIITPSGKTYIGMTSDSFNSRWNNHYKKLRANTHHCAGLQNSYNKYGWDNLEKIIIEEFIKPITAEDILLLHEYILKREVELWDEYKGNGIVLNGRPTGTGSVNHTEETRERMRLSSKKLSDNLCLVFFVNCVLCGELFCGRGASAKYCYDCVPIKNRRSNYLKGIITKSKICAGQNCCNFIVSRNKFCSDNCDNRVFNNICTNCNKAIPGRLSDNRSISNNIFCSMECSSRYRYRDVTDKKTSIIELFNNGKSYREIAVIVGCSHQTASNYIKKNTRRIINT